MNEVLHKERIMFQDVTNLYIFLFWISMSQLYKIKDKEYQLCHFGTNMPY